jgi:hypothetical protein
MNFGEMKTEVFRRLNESSSTPIYWKEVDVEDAINEGLEELSDASEWYETFSLIELASKTPFYDLRYYLPNTFLSPGRIQNQKTKQWLKFCSLRELDYKTLREWETVSGEPQKALMRGLWWLTTFPKASIDGEYIKFYYSAIPEALTEDTEEPAFPPEFHEALVEYAIYDLLVQDGESIKGLSHWAKYTEIEKRFTQFVQNRMKVDRIGYV